MNDPLENAPRFPMPQPQPDLPKKLVRAAEAFYNARCILASGSLQGVASLSWQAVEKAIIWLVSEGRAQLYKGPQANNDHWRRLYTGCEHFDLSSWRQKQLEDLHARWQRLQPVRLVKQVKCHLLVHPPNASNVARTSISNSPSMPSTFGRCLIEKFSKADPDFLRITSM